jgi:hypothetical protein
MNFGGIGGTAKSLLISPPFAQHPAISAASTLLRETARMSKWPTMQNTNDESAAPERLLSEQETADLTFGGSLYLLREARKSGSGPSWVRIGRGFYYKPTAVAAHQRGLQEFRSKAEFYSENPTAAELAERARGAMTYARKTRWTSQAKFKHRRSCAARVL